MLLDFGMGTRRSCSKLENLVGCTWFNILPVNKAMYKYRFYCFFCLVFYYEYWIICLLFLTENWHEDNISWGITWFESHELQFAMLSLFLFKPINFILIDCGLIVILLVTLIWFVKFLCGTFFTAWQSSRFFNGATYNWNCSKNVSLIPVMPFIAWCIKWP